MKLQANSFRLQTIRGDTHALYGGSMKNRKLVSAVLLLFLIIPFHLAAQANANPAAKKPATTLKVQVTFTETEGEKKVANLPYIFFLKVTESALPPIAWTKVRIGSRVPVYAGKDAGMQYIDVGTNIDAHGFMTDDGRFDITFDLERSWVEGDVLVPTQKSADVPNDNTVGAHFKEPIIRQSRTELSFIMHDGQTSQITQAADPLSGKLLTTTVSINVVK
jgi:hypothetical protein